jgi:hypothetical protein
VSGHFAIQARLTGAASLVALVGNRIYPDMMPEPPIYPAVTYQQTDGDGARSAVADRAMQKGIFEVTVWAKSRPETIAIAAQVKLALNRARKVIAGGIQIDDCFAEGDSDMRDPGTKIYSRHTTYRLHYREPA